MIDMNEGDFAYMIADIATGKVQGGKRTDLCKTILDPTFKLDIVGNFSKIAGPQSTEGYDREILKLTTINPNSASR